MDPVVAAFAETAVLELTRRAAGTGVIATELFIEFLVTTHDTDASFDFGFRGIPLAAFADDFDERAVLQFVCSFS